VGSILLVESDPESRDRLAVALGDSKHEVIVAHSTREAYQRISEGGIDVVVLDSYDPRVGVVELVREIDALPDTPPLVLVSASPHAPEISARIGAAAFLPKPVEPTELIAVVARIVGELRPVREIESEDFENAPTGSTRQFG
jgi:DNA-binding NtrC family response regulator